MEKQFTRVAALIGDPVRAKILWTLMDKRAYTASELAIYADTTAQNISMHLGKLVTAGLLTVESQGRHKYYNFSRDEVPYAIEAIASILPDAEGKKPAPATEKPIRFCRSCYDHLAGKVGVLLTGALQDKNFIMKQGGSFELTTAGESWFNSIGIDTTQLKKQKRAFAKPCLDWSERKHHLAGGLGAALLNYLVADGWVRRTDGSRIISVTGKGEQKLYEYFRLDLR